MGLETVWKAFLQGASWSPSAPFSLACWVRIGLTRMVIHLGPNVCYKRDIMCSFLIIIYCKWLNIFPALTLKTLNASIVVRAGNFDLSYHFLSLCSTIQPLLITKQTLFPGKSVLLWAFHTLHWWLVTPL